MLVQPVQNRPRPQALLPAKPPTRPFPPQYLPTDGPPMTSASSMTVAARPSTRTHQPDALTMAAHRVLASSA